MPGNEPVLLRGFNVTELIGNGSTVPAWARLVGIDGVRGLQPKETNMRNLTRPWIPPRPPPKRLLSSVEENLHVEFKSRWWT